ncbi:hypothetical protein [Actinoplanes sp. NPDC051494]|uniref:hypothetical protein n=1 Tax=Actinoplanes sp. NPDC051494 TaxID=3363907 RepID=UPI0037BC6F0C
MDACGPAGAEALLAHGHAGVAREFAGRGDWQCARVLARSLSAAGDRDGAERLLRPFAAAGWWPAVEALAVLLGEPGIDLVRSHPETLASLLGATGRLDDLLSLARGATGTPAVLRALVSATAGRGRDDEVEAVLREHGDPALLLAEVWERQGRVDEAIALLRPVPAAVPGARAHLAGLLGELLVDRGRPDEAIAVVDELGDPGWQVCLTRARLLIRCGRADEAVAHLTAHPAAAQPWESAPVAEILTLAGRPDEALAALRRGDDSDLLVAMLIERGLLGEAVSIMDDRSRRPADPVPDPWGDLPGPALQGNCVRSAAGGGEQGET